MLAASLSLARSLPPLALAALVLALALALAPSSSSGSSSGSVCAGLVGYGLGDEGGEARLLRGLGDVRFEQGRDLLVLVVFGEAQSSVSVVGSVIGVGASSQQQPHTLDAAHSSAVVFASLA